MLRVTATSTDGHVSERAASHGSVSGITEPGECWAVETRRDRITHTVIAWYFAREEDAHRRVHEVNNGTIFWKNTDQRNYDARVVPARAFEVSGKNPPRRSHAKVLAPTQFCPVHHTALPVTGRCEECS
jgi:hypothetical protein